MRNGVKPHTAGVLLFQIVIDKPSGFAFTAPLTNSSASLQQSKNLLNVPF
jgi:hypothetical protein